MYTEVFYFFENVLTVGSRFSVYLIYKIWLLNAIYYQVKLLQQSLRVDLKFLLDAAAHFEHGVLIRCEKTVENFGNE
jgi:hypothetical protein